MRAVGGGNGAAIGGATGGRAGAGGCTGCGWGATIVGGTGCCIG